MSILGQRNIVQEILLENARTLSERNKLRTLSESDMNAVNNTMISHLYKSAIDKAHVDFDDIPESRGDITRYSGYSSIMETIRVLKDISAKSGHSINELTVVEQAITHITGLRDIFQTGFSMNRDFIILEYNTLVLGVVQSVSAIISAYVDFVKKPDRQDITILKGKDRADSVSIENLAAFNKSVTNGDFVKANRAVISDGKENFTGVELAIPFIVIGAIMSIVPIIRELIFVFYFSRMKVSDFLSHQATLLEVHRANVEASSLPPVKKKEVLKKQASTISKLNHWSDKVKVDRVQSDRQAVSAMKKESQAWTLDTVQSQSAATDPTGFQLL